MSFSFFENGGIMRERLRDLQLRVWLFLKYMFVGVPETIYIAQRGSIEILNIGSEEHEIFFSIKEVRSRARPKISILGHDQKLGYLVEWECEKGIPVDSGHYGFESLYLWSYFYDGDSPPSETRVCSDIRNFIMAHRRRKNFSPLDA